MKTLGFCVAKVMHFVFILDQVLNPQPFLFRKSLTCSWSVKSKNHFINQVTMLGLLNLPLAQSQGSLAPDHCMRNTLMSQSSHCHLIIFDSQSDRFYLFVCLSFQFSRLGKKYESHCQNHQTLQELFASMKSLGKEQFITCPLKIMRVMISLRTLYKCAQLVWKFVIVSCQQYTMVSIKTWRSSASCRLKIRMVSLGYGV